MANGCFWLKICNRYHQHFITIMQWIRKDSRKRFPQETSPRVHQFWEEFRWVKSTRAIRKRTYSCSSRCILRYEVRGFFHLSCFFFWIVSQNCLLQWRARSSPNASVVWKQSKEIVISQLWFGDPLNFAALWNRLVLRGQKESYYNNLFFNDCRDIITASLQRQWRESSNQLMKEHENFVHSFSTAAKRQKRQNKNCGRVYCHQNIPNDRNRKLGGRGS